MTGRVKNLIALTSGLSTILITGSSPLQAGLYTEIYLSGSLYVGGVPNSMYITLPSTVQSPYGFTGCLASLDINGIQPDLTARPGENTDKLAKGCIGEGNISSSLLSTA